MLLAARNAMLMGGAKLPYDTEVEYIESTGTQWINSGIIARNEFLARCQFSLTSLSNTAIIGSLDTIAGVLHRNYMLYFDTSSPLLKLYGCVMSGIWNSYRCVSLGTILINTVYLVETGITNNTITLSKDGISSSKSADEPNGIPLGIFGINGGQNTTGYMRIYQCQMFYNTTLVRDFIPVRVGSGSSAVGYLYDRANPTGGPLGNGLYQNSGTGAFVVGPDK